MHCQSDSELSLRISEGELLLKQQLFPYNKRILNHSRVICVGYRGRALVRYFAHGMSAPYVSIRVLTRSPEVLTFRGET